MKKKTIVIAIIGCLILSFSMILLDYYRPIFVSRSHREKEEYESVADEMEPEEIKESRYRFAVFGDNMIHENVLNFANIQAGGIGKREEYELGFDFLPLYENIKKYVDEADYSVIHQASLVGADSDWRTLSGYPLFHSPKILGDHLMQIGFDAVNIANNHMLDMKEKGYYNSVNYWKGKSIDLVGGYLNQKEYENTEEKIKVFGDLRIAMLSYTATTNGLSASKSCPIPYFTVNDTAILKKQLTEDVIKAKENSDLVFVFINWGNSASFEPDETQKQTARILADAGADLILGTGPKVIQRIEAVSAKDSDHQAICVYSLGNIMGTMQYMENLLGGFVTFDIVKLQGDWEIQSLLFHPTVIHYNEDFTEIGVYPLSDYTQELYMEHGSNKKNGYGSYHWFQNTTQELIPTEYLLS